MAQTAVVSNTPFLWEGTDRNGKKVKGKSLAITGKSLVKFTIVVIRVSPNCVGFNVARIELDGSPEGDDRSIERGTGIGTDAHLVAGADHAHGNLTSVGNQYLFYF